jgi:hypothetical protein
MDEKYYRELMEETNRKRIAMGMIPFSWEEYKVRIEKILAKQRQDLIDYDEEGDREAEEME